MTMSCQCLDSAALRTHFGWQGDNVMRNTIIIVGIFVFVLAGTGSAHAQCGDPIGAWPYGPTFGAAGNGTTAVFGNGRVAQVADITDPTHPTVVAEIVLGDVIEGIVVNQGHAFIAAGKAGMAVIDISDPPHATRVATWPTDDMTLNVTVIGQRAYLANRQAGMAILDIGEPTNPVELGVIVPANYAWAVAVRGETAFVADAHDGLHIIDITDETNPQLVTTFTEAGGCYAVAISSDGDSAFVADYFEGMRVVDISNLASPALTAFVDVPSYSTDVTVEGNFAYLGNRHYGLRIYDISDPATPVEVRRVDNDGSTQRVRINSGLAYLANHSGGLRIIDVTVPSEAEELGFIESRPELDGPAINGSLAVITAGSELLILDVSDPSNPTKITTMDFQGYAEKAVIDGDLVYIADARGGIAILDLSDPADPVPIGYADTPDAYDLLLDGNHAFLACYGDGIRVIDVSDPTTPVVIGMLEGLTGTKKSLAYSDGTLFVREYNVGIHIIDVSTPSAPFEIGLIGDLRPMSRPAIQGNILYVPESSFGIGVFDISDLATPTEIARIYGPSNPFGITAVGQLLFIASIYDGSFVFDVSDPGNPIELATGPLATTAEGDISADGSLVVVVERDGGAEFFDLSPCFSEPPTADFKWSPSSPESGRQVQLTDTTIGTVETRQWSFNDGTTSTERNPRHVWTQAGTYEVTLTVNGPMGSSSVTKTITVEHWVGEIPPITEPGDHVYVIAAAAHAPGLEGTQWVTDVVLHNPGLDSAEAALWFMKSNQDNTGAEGVAVSVPPGASQLIEDIVLAIFGENEAAGGLLVGSNQPLVVTSRTYNDAQSGTFGQFIPGRTITSGVQENAVVHLIQLTRTPTFRTNLGVANPTPEAVRVNVSLLDSRGEELTSKNLNIPPFGHLQRTDIIGLNTKDAFAIISSPTPEANYFPYASVVDNRTGDPMLIEPIEPNQDFLVSASAHVGGLEDTDWRTDLEIFSTQTTAVDLQLDLLVTGEDNSSPLSITTRLDPGTGDRMVDVLDRLFSYEGTAALEVHSLSGEIVVSSRTFNTTADGTYGQFLPGVGSAATIFQGQEARIVHLSQDSTDDTGFRTNIGFVNRTGGTTRVVTDLYTADGTHLDTVNTNLKPFEHRQINRIFRQATSDPIANGYAVVTTTSANGSFVAYASVVDNASGDPIFIPSKTVSAQPPTFELIATGAGGSSGNYGTQDDLNLACTSWAGTTASVADWNDVVTVWQAAGESFADAAWIRSGHSYLVERDGGSFRDGSDEHYLIARHDGDLPPGFESLDDIGDHFIDLGAEEGVVLQVLCRRPLE